MKALVVFSILLLGCNTDTPIKYETCDFDGSNCKVFARFDDFESCQKHRTISNSLCDRVSEPGKIICKTCEGASEGCSTVPGRSQCTR
jgi:hypothetical protein